MEVFYWDSVLFIEFCALGKHLHDAANFPTLFLFNMKDVVNISYAQEHILKSFSWIICRRASKGGNLHAYSINSFGISSSPVISSTIDPIWNDIIVSLDSSRLLNGYNL